MKHPDNQPLHDAICAIARKHKFVQEGGGTPAFSTTDYLDDEIHLHMVGTPHNPGDEEEEFVFVTQHERDIPAIDEQYYLDVAPSGRGVLIRMHQDEPVGGTKYFGSVAELEKLLEEEGL